MIQPRKPISKISLVAPVFNERGVLADFLKEVVAALQQAAPTAAVEIILVDDGSADGSDEELDALCEAYSTLRIVHLSRNFGHGVAICAGLDHASGDVVILMDADLQDDPAAFTGFIQKWRDGFDVVYAVRCSRQESWISRSAFALFYWAMSWLVADIRLPRNAGTFSLMDRRVVDSIKSFGERNLYFSGIRAWAGFKQTGIDVPRRARYDKTTRVGWRGLWKLSLNALFSFSYAVLLAFRVVGFFTVIIALLILAYVAWHFLHGHHVPAWAPQVVATIFFAGVNLLGLGVIGDYVARIYDEVKGRPRYIISRIHGAGCNE